jgi:hypothetical protein
MGSDPPHNGTLALPPEPPKLWDDLRYQKLWLAARRVEWRSVALVGASASVDTLPVAELLAKLAWWYRGQPSCVFDLRDLSLRLVDYHMREVKSQVDAGSCVVVALRSVFENPIAIPVARSADAVVVCVGLGTTHLKAVEQTLAEVGSERVLGCVVVRPTKQPAGKSTGARTNGSSSA